MRRPIERELIRLIMSGSASPDDWRGTRALDFYDLKVRSKSLSASTYPALQSTVPV
jgi:hypothetical protein